jgi:sugar lactone lactonase YvrE
MGLPARRPVIALAIISAISLCAVANISGQQSPSMHLVSGPPTTVATIPFDSEGLTVDPDTGVMYVAEAPNAAGQCIVRSVTLNGVVTQIGIVPRPTGSACAPRGLEFREGRLYIADQSTGAEGWVFEMDVTTGHAMTFAAGVPGANGIAFDSLGNLWITDSLRGLGRVYRRDALSGAVQEAFRVPPVANGTVYGGLLSTPSTSGIGRQIINVPVGTQPEVKQVANGIAVVGRGNAATVFVSDTARGAIWAVTLNERGELEPGQTGCDPTLQPDTLCEAAVFVAHPRLEGADGIWVDRDGSLWVAANARQGIVRVDRQGRVTEAFRNPVNAQGLRSSADTENGNTHLLEFPSNPVIVPAFDASQFPTLCVTSLDRGGRDNWPGTVGEIGGPGQNKGKVSCFK